MVSDQAIDFTKVRTTTFYDGPQTTHVSFADPYCPTMRETLVKTAASTGHRPSRRGHDGRDRGTAVLDRAESKMFAQIGGDVIGMTQFPEALAGAGGRALLRRTSRS